MTGGDTHDAPITTAMVLAAGLGTRMRPLTETLPKPLVMLRGKPLIDHVLDRCVAAGVTRVVVNVHYLADKVEAHLAARRAAGCPLDIAVSDERDTLLDTGGGVKKALPLLGDAPFFVIASDTAWLAGPTPALDALARAFDPARMDMALLLAATSASVGYHAHGDFMMAPDGALRRRPERVVAPFAYASALVTHAAAYKDTPDGAFSNNRLFDAGIEARRLFGVRLDGIWMHVGTPGALKAAEAAYDFEVL